MKRTQGLVWGFCLLAATAVFGAGAQGSTAGKNIALGRPYVFSAAPSRIWENLAVKGTGRTPDYWSVLTDGKRIGKPGYLFSPGSVSFVNLPWVEVTIDLGSEQAISRIYNDHPSRPKAGIIQPHREVYYVSADGKVFYEVGSYVNPKDPPTVESDAARANFFEGIMRFDSGAIRTRGRYVRVRTYPCAGAGNSFRSVHYDEIDVIGASDEKSAAGWKLDTSAPSVSGDGIKLERDRLGYAYEPVDWNAVEQANPLWYALVPYSYLGEGRIALSRGGVEMLTFRPEVWRRGKMEGVVLSCTVPAALKLLDGSTARKMIQTPSADGRAVTYTFEVGEKPEAGLTEPFLLMETPAELKEGPLGTIEFEWHYVLDGKAHQSKRQQLELVVVGPVESARPKRFETAIWVPYLFRQLKQKEPSLERVLKYYQGLGFKSVNGQDGAWVHEAGESLGMRVMGAGLLPNGLMFDMWNAFGQKGQVTEDKRFVFYPKRENPPYGICPEVLASDAFHPTLLKATERRLETAEDVYSNWEPYMFLGHGCACDRCRAAFQAFSGWSDAKMKAAWPAIVADQGSAVHNRFLSMQMGRILRTMQATVDEANKALGRASPAVFAPAMAPKYFDPDDAWNHMHDPAEYAGSLRRLILWGYPYTFNGLGMNLLDRIGCNNTMIREWGWVESTLAKKGKSLREVGWLLLAPDQGARFTTFPKDVYYHLMLSFVRGMRGYSTYGSTLPTTEQMALLGRAHRQIAQYEDVAFDGDEMAGVSAAPASPTAAGAGEIVGTARGWALKDRRVVAVGNDALQRVYMKVAMEAPAGRYWLIDREGRRAYGKDGKGFEASALKAGVLVRVEAKDWVFLELGQEVPQGFEAVEAGRVKGEMERERAELGRFAERLR